MDLVRDWIKYINYPVAMKLCGYEERIKSFNDCVKKQYRSYDENLSEMKNNLYNIVDYAIHHVPYYQDLDQKNRWSFSRNTIIDDIKQLPVLTKDIIRKEGNRLYSTENLKYYITTSGGSTGEPVQLRRDQYLERIHPQNYFLSYAGYDIGDKKVLLWGSERDILQGSVGIKAQISNRFIQRQKMLNSFMMTRNDMLEYVHTINQWKPEVILAYTQSIFELSRFIKEENLEIFSPGGIVVSAGTLYNDWRKEIEEVFRCPVINQYGSRETPGIAVSCAEDSQLHINTFMNYVEVVDDQDNTLPCGIDGNILVTSLINKSMPILRYKIGDIGALSTKKECKCGRNLPCLMHVTGRTVNVFKRRDGAKIDGEYFTHLFYGIAQIEKFQVIQKDYEEIEINLQVTEKLIEKKEKEIKNNVRVVMGENCNVEINYVDKVLPTKSGKFLYTVSLI